MKTPVTTVGEGFSDPEAGATTWDETRGILESAPLFWLTTVRKNGLPHVTPVIAVWLDEALYFSTVGTEQKDVNVAANPHVVLTTGCNGWESGVDVVVEGEASVVKSDHLLAHLADVWSLKWDGRWRFEVRNGFFYHPDGAEVTVYEVKTQRVYAFAKGTFVQTKHQF
jgi:general stress protein 26